MDSQILLGGDSCSHESVHTVSALPVSPFPDLGAPLDNHSCAGHVTVLLVQHTLHGASLEDYPIDYSLATIFAKSHSLGNWFECS